MANLTIRLFLGLALVLLLLTTGTGALSTFHQDVAFSYTDTAGIPVFPFNTYDDPALLDRLGTGAVFEAAFPGTYAFVFHAPGKNASDPMFRINYQFSRFPVAGSYQPVLLLAGDGPVTGHVLLELETGDQVTIEIVNGSTTPIVNTTTPVVFNGFLIYHRCLCSPLVLRQSAFSASRSTKDVGLTDVFIDELTLNLGSDGEFDPISGIFAASIPGIYVFMYSFPNQGVGSAGTVAVSLTVNGAVQSTVSSVSSTVAAVEYAGTTVVVDLVIGDRVRLEKQGGQIVLSPPGSVSPILFSGFLL